MPDQIQELRQQVADLRARLTSLRERKRSLQLAGQIRQRSFSDIAAEQLGGTPEQFQVTGPPGRPVTTTGFERDVAKLQSEPLIGLASRGAERLGARPVQRALQGASLIPGPIGDIAGSGAEAIGERLERRETAREEVAPEVSVPSQIASSLADVGVDIGLLGRTPGIGKTLIAPIRATARTGAGRVAQRVATEGAQGAGIETALSTIEGEPLDEIVRRQQLGFGIGGGLGAAIGGTGEIVRLRNKLTQAKDRLAQLQQRRQQLTRSAAQRAEEGTGVGRLDQRAEQRAAQIREGAESLEGRADIRQGAEVEAGLEGAKRRARQRQVPPDIVGSDLEARSVLRREALEAAEQSERETARRTAVGAENVARREAAEAGRQQTRQRASDLVEEVGEVAVRGERRGELPASLRSVFDRVNTQRGAVDVPAGGVLPTLTTTSGGALTGAALDEENRGRGALVGGLTGLGVGAAALKRATRAANVVDDAAVRPLSREAGVVRRQSGLPPHSRRIQQQIRSGKRDISIPTFNDLYRSLVRKQAGVESAERTLTGGRAAASTQSPTVAAELATGSARRAEGALTVGVPKWTPDGNIQIVGESLEDILAPLAGKADDFERYELAARTVELGPRGKRTGVSLEDAQAEIANASPLVKQAHERAVQYRRQVLEYWADAGGVSPEGMKAMEELGQHYMPLRRIFEGLDPISGAGRIGQVGQQVKALTKTGSLRRTVGSIESTIDQTNRLIRAADMNRVSLRLVEMAEANPAVAAGFMERVGQPVGRAVATKTRNLQEAAARRGLTLSDEAAGELTVALADDQTLSVADDILRVWRNGKQEQWRLAPGLAKGIRAMGPQQSNMFVTLMSAPAQTLKAGVTLNPAFQAFNFIRDAFDATLQSQYGFKLGIDSFKGLYESVKGQWLGKGSKAYNDFVLGGGGFSSFRGSRSKTLQQQRRAVLPQTHVGKVSQKVLHPLEALKEFGAPFEEAARMGEFLRARESGANVMESILASKKVTVDFQQAGSGAVMQALSQMTAFLNPAIQSMDTMMRVAARPVTKTRAALREGATTGKAARIASGEAARVYGTAIGAISLPSALLWAANKDDQDIEDLRKTNQGLIYWFYRKPGGDIGRVPKPFMWGQIFGTGMESALDQFFDNDPEAGRRFIEGVKEQGLAQMIPTIAQTYVEQKSNKDAFFGTPIVPPERTDLSPRFQYKPRTGTIARAVGDRFNVSPARMEAVWRDVMGSLGSNALQLLDRAADKLAGAEDISMAPVPSDNMLWGRFTARFPTTNVEPIQTFYEQQREVSIFSNDIADLEKTDPARAAAEIQARPMDFALIPVYEASRQKMADIRSDMEFIRKQPVSVISKKEKQRIIDELTLGLVEVARSVNEAVGQFRREN